jgi:phosphoglucomutase
MKFTKTTNQKEGLLMNQEYTRWLAQKDLSLALRTELQSIQNDDDAIKDRFWRHLEFGTGGLRGEIGAGNNRMNIHTVGRASQGLANYLNQTFETPSICIAYDTRNMSKEFATMAARVFCANGVKTYIFDDVRPTPMLSFAVRHKKASAGIVITASHNPKQYNGYKVYGPDGGQITDEAASSILDQINRVDVFDGVKTTPLDRTGLLSVMGEETDAPYYKKVKNLVIREKLVKEKASGLKILYSPLHGTGNIPVRRVLKELGFSQVQVVPAQEKPDGNFPTAPYPNPEEPSVYALAIEMAKTSEPDLIFATDPDCDRIGVLVKNEADEYSVLSGNQVGALLADYILSTKQELGTLPRNAAVVKTIVTTDIARPICAHYGVGLVDTLTGFKYIGEKVGEWEESKKYAFQFGFEESYGYLSGDFVRDKDAVIAAALIAEMALFYKENGLSLFQAMDKLYRRFGYTAEKLLSFSMPGQEGQQQIAAIIANLRSNYKSILASENLAVFEDYKASVRTHLKSGEMEIIHLPTSNVLKFIFGDGSWLVLRPSGTEPKIKLYVMATSEDSKGVAGRLEDIVGLAQAMLK